MTPRTLNMNGPPPGFVQGQAQSRILDPTTGQPFARRTGVDDPFRGDGYPLPHVWQFTAVLSGAQQTYFHDSWDEARRNSRQNSLAMERDVFLQAILQERKLATSGLSWHVEVDDEKDPYQKTLKDGLQVVIRSTPYLQRHHYAGLDAIWYGRHGIQHRKVWKELDLPTVNFQPAVPATGGGPEAAPGTDPTARPSTFSRRRTSGGRSRYAGEPGLSDGQSDLSVAPDAAGTELGGFATRGAPAVLTRATKRRRCWVVDKHQPVHGDSIGHKWDGTPYILVYSARARQLAEQGAEIIDPRNPDEDPLPPGEITLTTGGSYGLVLREPYWRDRFIIHSHLSIAGEFFDVERAEAIHGAGIRDILYWFWWLKNEWLEWVVSFFERVGLGINVWAYEAGNQASYNEVFKLAEQQSRRANILVPFYANKQGAGAGGLERIETPVAGAEALLALKKSVEDHAERYIIGQTLSSDHRGSGGLGGSGAAEFQQNTKFQIVKFDAENLADTYTQDWLKPTQEMCFPDLAEIPVRFAFNTPDPEGAERLEAVTAAFSMGVDFVKNEVRSLTGLSDPQPGDDIIGGAMAVAAAAGTGQEGPGGSPSETAGPGAADGEAGGEPTFTDRDVETQTPFAHPGHPQRYAQVNVPDPFGGLPEGAHGPPEHVHLPVSPHVSEQPGPPAAPGMSLKEIFPRHPLHVPAAPVAGSAPEGHIHTGKHLPIQGMPQEALGRSVARLLQQSLPSHGIAHRWLTATHAQPHNDPNGGPTKDRNSLVLLLRDRHNNITAHHAHYPAFYPADIEDDQSKLAASIHPDIRAYFRPNTNDSTPWEVTRPHHGQPSPERVKALSAVRQLHQEALNAGNILKKGDEIARPSADPLAPGTEVPGGGIVTSHQQPLKMDQGPVFFDRAGGPTTHYVKPGEIIHYAPYGPTPGVDLPVRYAELHGSGEDPAPEASSPAPAAPRAAIPTASPVGRRRPLAPIASQGPAAAAVKPVQPVKAIQPAQPTRLTTEHKNALLQEYIGKKEGLVRTLQAKHPALRRHNVDMESVYNDALMKAVDTFDTNQMDKFEPYLINGIHMRARQDINKDMRHRTNTFSEVANPENPGGIEQLAQTTETPAAQAEAQEPKQLLASLQAHIAKAGSLQAQGKLRAAAMQFLQENPEFGIDPAALAPPKAAAKLRQARPNVNLEGFVNDFAKEGEVIFYAAEGTELPDPSSGDSPRPALTTGLGHQVSSPMHLRGEHLGPAPLTQAPLRIKQPRKFHGLSGLEHQEMLLGDPESEVRDTAHRLALDAFKRGRHAYQTINAHRYEDYGLVPHSLIVADPHGRVTAHRHLTIPSAIQNNQQAIQEHLRTRHQEALAAGNVHTELQLHPELPHELVREALQGDKLSEGILKDWLMERGHHAAAELPEHPMAPAMSADWWLHRLQQPPRPT